MIQKVDSVETEADVIMRTDEMRTSSDVYVNLRDFADDIHELLP